MVDTLRLSHIIQIIILSTLDFIISINYSHSKVPNVATFAPVWGICTSVNQ